MPQLPRAHDLVSALVLTLGAFLSLSALAQVKNPPGKDGDLRPASDAPAILRGQAAFKDKCAICHFSGSDARKIGPGLRAIYAQGKFPDGGKVDDASMEKWILSGGKNMPPFKQALNSGQIHDLIAYLKTL